jgi:hypothetical protein
MIAKRQKYLSLAPIEVEILFIPIFHRDKKIETDSGTMPVKKLNVSASKFNYRIQIIGVGSNKIS